MGEDWGCGGLDMGEHWDCGGLDMGEYWGCGVCLKVEEGLDVVGDNGWRGIRGTGRGEGFCLVFI